MLRPWLAGVVNVLFRYSKDRAIAALVMTALLWCVAYFRVELSKTWEYILSKYSVEMRGEKAAVPAPVDFNEQGERTQLTVDVDSTFTVDPVPRAYQVVVRLTLTCIFLGAVGGTVVVGPADTQPLSISSFSHPKHLLWDDY